jgi:hypothetical protein
LLRPIAIGMAGVGLPYARSPMGKRPARSRRRHRSRRADEVPLRHGGKLSKTESLNGPMLGPPHRARSGAARPKIGIRARPAPRSQLACCNTLTSVNSGFAFRLRRTVPRYGDTPQPSRDNVLRDTIHSTSCAQGKNGAQWFVEADLKKDI